MELQDKIQKAMEADFIGDLQFDGCELEQMKKDCKSFYRHAQQSWSKIYRSEDIDKLVVLIVNIAKTWDDDKESRFWVKLFGEIFDDASISPTKFYDAFESSLERHGKTLFLSKEKNNRRFREVFLLHAFAPDKSRDSFVRLLWSWYTDPDVVGYDFQPNDPLYAEIANFLNNKFSDEANMDEDSSFEGKTYAIKSSFKYLFTQSRQQGVKLLNALFAFFDDIYFNGRYDNNSFYSERCYEIINRILDESNDKIKHRKRITTEHIISDYSKIYAAYEIDDYGNAAIFIPEIRAIDESADEYALEVLNDECVIFETQDYIVGNDLKRKIKRISMPFDLFGRQAQKNLHFRVKMYVLQDGYLKRLIYDSKESLYREFILFRTSREIRLQNCKPNTYYIVHPRDLQIEKLTTCSVHNINQFTSTIIAEENDYITGLTQQVFFSQQPKDLHISIDGRNIESIVFVRDNIEYPFYKTVKSLKIFLDKSLKPESVIVRVDNGDRFYPISNCATKDGNTYIIDLHKLNAEGNGCHTVYISDSSKQKLLHKVIYYVNNTLSFNATQNGYVFDRNTVNFAIQTNDEGINRALYFCKPQSGLESLSYPFNDGQIAFALPYIKWRIDDSDEWYYGSYGRDLWREDDTIHSNCVIEIVNCSRRDVSLLINDEDVPTSSSEKYLLGDALIKRTKNKSNDVILRIDMNEFRLFTVHNKPFLSDIDIDLDNKVINLLPYYIGNRCAQFSIILENEDNRYEITSGTCSPFDIDIMDGEYTVSVYIIDFFGKLETVPIFKGDCTIGNPDKFYFAHSRIILDSFKKPEGGKIRLSNAFITNIQYLREEAIGAVYSGSLICNRKRFSVEVYKKGNNSLKFYIIDGDRLLSANFNTAKNEFVIEEPNEKNIIPCSSCYYTKEVI